MPRTRRATPEAAPAGERRNDGGVNAAKRSDKETVVTLRLPRELHDRLRKAGGERGLTAQIRDRLDASLAVEEACEDPVFADFLRASGYVVVTTARLYPSDPDTYSMIELAVRMLLDAFRPATAPDIVHEVYVPTTMHLLAKVERLMGFALGALGERGIAAAANMPFVKIASEADKREDEEGRA